MTAHWENFLPEIAFESIDSGVSWISLVRGIVALWFSFLCCPVDKTSMLFAALPWQQNPQTVLGVCGVVVAQLDKACAM